MLGNLSGWHLLIILAVVVLIFGAARLPALAKSVGQSARILKTEVKSMKTDGDEPAVAPTPLPAAPGLDTGTTRGTTA